MKDIVERLCDRVDDAVQEITTLRAEVEWLRAALRDIANCKTFTDRKYMIDIARAALKEDT